MRLRVWRAAHVIRSGLLAGDDLRSTVWAIALLVPLGARPSTCWPPFSSCHSANTLFLPCTLFLVLSFLLYSDGLAARQWLVRLAPTVLRFSVSWPIYFLLLCADLTTPSGGRYRSRRGASVVSSSTAKPTLNTVGQRGRWASGGRKKPYWLRRKAFEGSAEGVLGMRTRRPEPSWCRANGQLFERAHSAAGSSRRHGRHQASGAATNRQPAGCRSHPGRRTAK
jgi:hypothetical protein